jgi:hypothetical protein
MKTVNRLQRRRKAAPSRNGHAEAQPITTVATAAAPATPAAQDERGADGRFKTGNVAASRNPFHRATAERRKALLAAVTDEDVAAVARKLRDQALAGDVAAAKVLLQYVVGKPHPAPDPDRTDAAELALMREWPCVLSIYDAVAPVSPALAVEALAARGAATPEQLAALRLEEARRLQEQMASLQRQILERRGLSLTAAAQGGEQEERDWLLEGLEEYDANIIGILADDTDESFGDEMDDKLVEARRRDPSRFEAAMKRVWAFSREHAEEGDGHGVEEAQARFEKRMADAEARLAAREQEPKEEAT